MMSTHLIDLIFQHYPSYRLYNDAGIISIMKTLDERAKNQLLIIDKKMDGGFNEKNIDEKVNYTNAQI